MGPRFDSAWGHGKFYILDNCFKQVNNLIRLAISLCAFVLFFIVVSAQDTVRVESDIIGDIVSINVPDNVYLGNVSRGFKTNESIQIAISNTGTTNIMV